MIQRLQKVFRLALLVVLAGFSFVAVASADSLEFIVDRADGSVYIKNPTAAAITFDGYQFESAGGLLDPSAWTPISGNYDLAGDQSVDSVSDWIIGTSSTSLVAEASLTELSASIASNQIVSLGLFFTSPFAVGSVEISSGVTSENIEIDFRILTADYDGDLDVDLDDYGVFSSTYGSTADLRADGNNDGVIDAADYTIWRDSDELLLTPAAPVAAFALAVPEPSPLASLLFAAAISITQRRRAGRQLVPAGVS